MADLKVLKDIALNGTPAEKRELFSFTLEESDERIVLKYKLFARSCYPQYFTHKAPPHHDTRIKNYLQSYRGIKNGIEIAYRGDAKTSHAKLFLTFVILNDKNAYRRYMKVLSRDLKNAAQLVTDVYNNIVSVSFIYGDIFEKEGDIKREERMGSFTTKRQQKLIAGTVGQTQRGHLQDAFRPDWVLFEDVEDRESVSSIAITEGVIQRSDEAIQGLAFDGSYHVNANYISDAGTIQWFLNKAKILKHIVPIVDGAGKPAWDRYTPDILEKLKADSEDWAGEYLCVRPGTKVLTDNGWQGIESLNVGDIVITHRGQKQKVLKVFESQSDDLIDITANGETVTITKNHPVLAVVNGIEDWVPAGELTTEDYVIVIPHGKL